MPQIIYTIMRKVAPEEIEWTLKDCIELKQAFPRLIAGAFSQIFTERRPIVIGYDLVGPEDGGRPLIDFIEPLLKFKDMQKEAGVEIPYIFHAGECLGDGNSTDSNLYDAILLGTKRIGHGCVPG